MQDSHFVSIYANLNCKSSKNVFNVNFITSLDISNSIKKKEKKIIARPILYVFKNNYLILNFELLNNISKGSNKSCKPFPACKSCFFDYFWNTFIPFSFRGTFIHHRPDCSPQPGLACASTLPTHKHHRDCTVVVPYIHRAADSQDIDGLVTNPAFWRCLYFTLLGFCPLPSNPLHLTSSHCASLLLTSQPSVTLDYGTHPCQFWSTGWVILQQASDEKTWSPNVSQWMNVLVVWVIN